MTSNALAAIDRLKDELNALHPLTPDVVGRVEQKLRIESNYHSNAIEGNQLTLGETRSLILHGLTAHGKPMRDHLDVQGHDDAIKAVEEAIREAHGLNEVFIRNLHRVLMKEPYEAEAIAPDGTPAKRRIAIGEYKTMPNNVRTSTGETYYFTPPEQVRPEMTDLIDWYRDQEAAGEHPIIIAATFHYRFVRIHPFDDGNGRMARLLMNLILLKHGYTVAIVAREKRDPYLEELERADRSEDLTQFIDFIASCCHYALDLHLRAARGDSIENVDEIDREIELFKRSLGKETAPQNPIALRTYIRQVINPLYEHCNAKIHLFSDILVMTSASQHVHAFDINNRDFHRNYFDGTKIKTRTVPKKARWASFRFIFSLRNAKIDGIYIKVENQLTGRISTWTFTQEREGNILNSHAYEGQNLEHLELAFNQLLRMVMARNERQG